VIFKEGLNVRGLNTAATLWCSAAVGLLAGEGFALYGFLAAALVVGANTALRPIVHAINRQPVETIEEEQRYVIAIDCRAAIASEVRAALVRELSEVPEIHFSGIESVIKDDSSRVEVTAIVTSQKRRELLLEAIVARFTEVAGVAQASWRLTPQAE